MGTVAASIRHCLMTLGRVARWLLRVLWAVVRFLLNRQDERLHTARFAKAAELSRLVSSHPPADGLLLGSRDAAHFISVRPTPTRRELGNLLVVAPTRGGKGLLAELERGGFAMVRPFQCQNKATLP